MAGTPRTRFVLLSLGACALGALSLFVTTAARRCQEMRAEGLVRLGGGQMMLILAEKAGARRLAVPLTHAEAELIDGALHGGKSLGAEALAALGGQILSISIDEALSLRDFRAHLTVSSGSRELRLEASAGEALSLALQSGAPIMADGVLLEEAGVSPDDLRGKRARDLRTGSAPAPVIGL